MLTVSETHTHTLKQTNTHTASRVVPLPVDYNRILNHILPSQHDLTPIQRGIIKELRNVATAAGAKTPQLNNTEQQVVFTARGPLHRRHRQYQKQQRLPARWLEVNTLKLTDVVVVVVMSIWLFWLLRFLSPSLFIKICHHHYNPPPPHFFFPTY